MKKILVFTFIGTILLVTSCKSRQVITEGERAKSASHLITLIQGVQPSFENMSANVRVNLDMNGQSYSSPAAIRIITDSVIVMTLSPFLGMEMFSVELYPDRWIIYDKMNLKYVTDNYRFLSYRYGININYHDLQSVFSARLFEAGNNTVDYTRYRFVPLEGNRNEIIFDNQQLTQTTRTNNINAIESVDLRSKSQDYLLTVSYHDYLVARGVNFPRTIRMNLQVDGAVNISMDMNIQKVNFNTDVRPSLSRPDRYTRVTLDQLFTK